MKNTYKYLLFLVPTLSLVVFFACKKTNPAEGLSFQVNSNIYISPVQIQYVNANPLSNNQVIDNIPVTISGPGDTMVVLGDGSTTPSDFKISKGILQLALKFNAAPSPSNPIVFTVNTGYYNGFAPTTKTFTITDSSKSIQTISVIEAANPANGTYATTSNSLQNTVQYQSQQQNITITQPTNANYYSDYKQGGTLVTSNTTNVYSTFWNGQTKESVLAFPDNIKTLYAYDTTNKPVNGGNNITFASVGCLHLGINYHGNSIFSSDKPFSVQFDLPNGAINTFKQSPFSDGDTIPLWFKKDNSQNWTLQSNVAIVSTINGKKVATFKTNNFGYFNAAYWQEIASAANYFSVGNKGKTVNTIKNPSLTINLSTPQDTNFVGNYFYTLFNISNNDTLTIKNESGSFNKGAAMISESFQGFPNPGKCGYKLLIYVHGNPVTTWGNIANLDTSGFNIAVTDSSFLINPVTHTALQTVDLSVSMAALCKNRSGFQINFSGWAYLLDNTATDTAAATQSIYIDGISNNIFHNLVVGRSYTFKIWSGKFYESKVTIQTSPVNQPNWGSLSNLADTSTAVTANAVYNSSLNQLQVQATFTVSCP